MEDKTEQQRQERITELTKKVDHSKLPKHVAIIMDGNGRWAVKHGEPRLFGHRHGVKSVDEIVQVAVEIGIKYLTLYAFSTENWGRPKTEVDGLMEILVETIKQEVPNLIKNKISLKSIGDLSRLPEHSRVTLLDAIEATSKNSKMTLIIALNYSAKWEIIEAVRKIAYKSSQGQLDPAKIDEQIFTDALSTKGVPDPELLIRTSGETRISNFLLWQLAYAELHFTSTFWPDFKREHFLEAIIEYQNRERRFGLTSAQIQQGE